ncbi:MAG: DNRLRE domain-containing protein [Candidatus Edwardsbacteria bacterium]|nr:DNRLRE domain-containing protein [Candidatus Edwardsbacteria bacterium]
MRTRMTAIGRIVTMLLAAAVVPAAQAPLMAMGGKPTPKASTTVNDRPAPDAKTTAGGFICPVSQDTWVYAFRPDRNYGDGLGWKDRTDPTQDLTVPKVFLGFGGTDEKLGLFRFDTNALPQGRKPSRATLRAYNDFAGSDAALTLEAKAVLGPWEESKVTWKTRPQLGPAVASLTLKGAIGYGQSGRWCEWDVTAIVAGWAAGTPSFGIALDPVGEAGVDRDFVCKEYAKMAGYAPQLVVEYGPPAAGQ